MDCDITYLRGSYYVINEYALCITTSKHSVLCTDNYCSNLSHYPFLNSLWLLCNIGLMRLPITMCSTLKSMGQYALYTVKYVAMPFYLSLCPQNNRTEFCFDCDGDILNHTKSQYVTRFSKKGTFSTYLTYWQTNYCSS